MREVKNTKIFSEVWEVKGVRERFDIRIAGPGMIFRQYSSLRELSAKPITWKPVERVA